MSLLEATATSVTNTEAHDLKLAQAQAQASTGLMIDDAASEEKPDQHALTAHEHARAVIRLIQCPQCSKPYRAPVTLPCGNSLCRQCLPDSYRRVRVTYPDTPGRKRAIQCPYVGCAREHTTAECNIDVTLSKVMESIEAVVANQNVVSGVEPMDVEKRSGRADSIGPEAMSEEKPAVIANAQSRLVATYNLAVSGGLSYDAQVIYEKTADDTEQDRQADQGVLAELLESSAKELDCQVCYNLMLDPVTTACGHTLCRRCLARSLDHSLNCPVCRRQVLLPTSLYSQPSNKTLVDLLNGLCPELVTARAEASALDDNVGAGELDTAIFVCTLGFPGCPTFLHIFEPRYRLMIRRALEGNRTFGMTMYNSRGLPQGDLGPTMFMEYGILLRIESVQMAPDGRSIIETKGLSRFKVKRSGTLDGYTVGEVERIEDVPLAEEERLEMEETSLPPAAENDLEGQINRMTTRELLMFGLEFIMRMQDRSAPWLQEQILRAYGGPPQDASLFPYWLASILPINDEEKYRLLQTNSVRQRLKIVAMWTKHMEAQRWWVHISSSDDDGTQL